MMHPRSRLLVFFIALVCNACRFSQKLSVDSEEEGHNGYRLEDKDRWLIAPGFEDAEEFEGHFAWVKKGGKWGVINRWGRTVLPFNYDSYTRSYEAESVFFAKQGERISVVRLGSRCRVSDSLYDAAWSVQWQEFRFMTFVKKNGKLGLLTSNLRELLPPICDTIVWQSGDCWLDPILYSVNDKCGMINHSGRQVIPPVYDSISVCVTWDSNNGAHVTWLNDSVAFFNNNARPFRGKVEPGLREDMQQDWGGEGIIGCTWQRRKTHR